MLRLLIVGILCLVAVSAEARPKHKVKPTPCSDIFCDITAGVGGTSRTTVINAPAEGGFSTKGEVIGGRPPGCPHRYCGCGTSIYFFGRIVPGLNLARNWSGFPAAEAAPETAAWRNGHVFALVSHVEGTKWLVHDSNSGRGKTRLHVRDIRGYRIVNPRGNNRYASL